MNHATQLETSRQYILAELTRIDLLIRAQVLRARQIFSYDDRFLGLRISEEEVDELIAAPMGLPRWATEPAALLPEQLHHALAQIRTQIDERKAASQPRGIAFRLDTLAEHCGLDSLDIDILLVCLAQEIDLRYVRLYAYLQDNVNKKWPSVDLVLNLLCPSLEEKLAARTRFKPHAPLRRHQLITMMDDPGRAQTPLLGKFLKVDERIVSYLLSENDIDEDEMDERLQAYAQVISPRLTFNDWIGPDELKQRLRLLSRVQETSCQSLVVCFQGAPGVGKTSAAEALANELKRTLLMVDTAHLLETQTLGIDAATSLLVREATLQNAVLFWKGADCLLGEQQRVQRKSLLKILHDSPGITIFATSKPWDAGHLVDDRVISSLVFPPPTVDKRQQLWTTALNGFADTFDTAALAQRFRLTGGQIQHAITAAQKRALWQDADKDQITQSDLYAACRNQSGGELATLARKVEPLYRWEDIVLPADTLNQLRELCQRVAHHHQVLHEWGFAQKLAQGQGVNALFAGPSGTGKTMAAEIIANELGLDLYKIDLSGVVSKYIGETEKNLNRIFNAAEDANAILLFDEADALFGKRSEVRDAHDRYANIEISYLLQRMEEYSGLSILTTNLRHNLDSAFVRRLAFTIHFPFPDEAHRRQIWAGVWPQALPLDSTVNLEHLTQHFKLAGGNIKNIALASAYLAAADGGMVTMEHLLHATQREYQKMGKTISVAELNG